MVVAQDEKQRDYLQEARERQALRDAPKPIGAWSDLLHAVPGFTSIAKDLASFQAGLDDFQANQFESAGIPGLPTALRYRAEGLRKWSSEFQDLVESVAPESDTTVAKVSRGVGQGVGFIASTMATGGAAGAAMRVAALGALTAGGAAYEEAKRYGATDDQAMLALVANGMVGTSEAIPLARILTRINKGSGGTLVPALVNAIAEGGEEAIQEGVQTIAANLIARHLAQYDEDRKWFEDAIESGRLGFFTGVILSALGTGAGKAFGKSPEGETGDPLLVEGQEPPEAQEPVLIDQKREPAIVGPMSPEHQKIQQEKAAQLEKGEPITLTEEEQAKALEDLGAVAKDQYEAQELRKRGPGIEKPKEEVEVEVRQPQEEVTQPQKGVEPERPGKPKLYAEKTEVPEPTKPEGLMSGLPEVKEASKFVEGVSRLFRKRRKPDTRDTLGEEGLAEAFLRNFEDRLIRAKKVEEAEELQGQRGAVYTDLMLAPDKAKRINRHIDENYVEPALRTLAQDKDAKYEELEDFELFRQAPYVNAQIRRRARKRAAEKVEKISEKKVAKVDQRLALEEARVRGQFVERAKRVAREARRRLRQAKTKTQKENARKWAFQQANKIREDFQRKMTAMEEKAKKAYEDIGVSGELQIEELSAVPDKFGAGISDADAYAGLVEILSGPHAKAYIAADRHVRRLVKEQQRALVKYGFVTQEVVDQWNAENPYYIPSKTLLPPGDQRRGSRRVLHRRKGRMTKPDAPLSFLVSDSKMISIQGERNLALRDFAEVVRERPQLGRVIDSRQSVKLDPITGLRSYPPSAIKRDEQDRAIPFYEDGKEKWMVLNDPHLAHALKAPVVRLDGLANLLRKVFAPVRLWAMANTTANIEFITSNVPKDLQTAAINMNAGPVKARMRKVLNPVRLARYSRHLWREVRGKDRKDTEEAKYTDMFLDDGGFVDWATFEDVEKNSIRLASRVKELQHPKHKSFVSIRGYFKFAADLNHVGEQIARVSYYQELIEQGVPRKTAALAAKELTVNFSKQGEWSSVANVTYVYATTSLKGLLNVGRAIRKSPKVRAMVGGLVVAGFFEDQWNHMIAGDDWDKIPEWKKRQYWHFAIPDWLVPEDVWAPIDWMISEDPKGNRFLSMPKPWVYQIFPETGRNISGARRGAIDKGQFFENMTVSFLEAVNPLAGGGDIVRTILPTAIRPAYEIQTNKNWFGGKIRRESWDPDPVKAYTYWDGGGIEPYAWFTKRMNELGGGDVAHSSWLDMYPENIQHLIEFAGGGVMRFHMSIFEGIRNGEWPRIGKMPVMRKFLEWPSEWHGWQEYSDASDELERLEGVVRKYEKAGEFGKAQQTRSANINLWGRRRVLNNIQERLKKLDRDSPQAQSQRDLFLSIYESAKDI